MSGAVSIRHTRVSIALFVWLAAASLALGQGELRLERLVHKYNKLVDAGKLDKAERLADRATTEFPNSAAAGLMSRHSRLLAEAERHPTGLEPISRAAGNERYSVVYAVADLVVPVPQAVIAAESAQVVRASAEADFDSLIEKITAAVLPESWESAGGTARIAAAEQNLSLVITQTAKGHEGIADLLEQLRRYQDVQITLEARWISVPVETLPEGVALPGLQESTVVGSAQTRTLIEFAQSDRHGGILYAPKMTLLNGQTGEIATGDSDPAWLMMQPVVSDDRRSIRLALSYGNRKENGLITSLTRVVPDQATLVIGYKELAVETGNECGVPMLSKLPYTNRLFRNAGPERRMHRLVLAVTPRLIFQEEEEERLGVVE